MLCELPDVVDAVEATLLVGMVISVEATDVVVAVEATLLVGMGVLGCSHFGTRSYVFRIVVLHIAPRSSLSFRLNESVTFCTMLA